MKTNNYHSYLQSLIGKEIDVIIDRPIRSVHPVHKDIIYDINYGYTKLVIAPDNEYQDVYVLGVDNPIENYKGEVKAIVHRLNDNEDKLVVGPKDVLYTCEEIKTKINFIEKFFEIEIII